MARPSPRRGGIVSLSVNGEQLDVADDLEYQLSGDEREAATGPTGVQGYITKPIVPFFATSLRDSDTFDAGLHSQITGATVTVELTNGKTITLRDAWATGAWSQQAVEGTIAARWEGLSASEV